MKETRISEAPETFPTERLDKLAEGLSAPEGSPKNAGEAGSMLESLLKNRQARETGIFPRGPMEMIFSGDWDRLSRKEGLAGNLRETNPDYELGPEWKTNCQRCVPTSEMRRRGYDVTSRPRPDGVDPSGLARDPFDVWKDPEVITGKGNGLADIEKNMAEWGDGARAQVVVQWKNTNSGHTFCAEQIDGKTVFYDPQTGGQDVSNYFKQVEPGSVRFCRIDRLDVTDKIRDCCRKAE